MSFPPCQMGDLGNRDYLGGTTEQRSQEFGPRIRGPFAAVEISLGSRSLLRRERIRVDLAGRVGCMTSAMACAGWIPQTAEEFVCCVLRLICIDLGRRSGEVWDKRADLETWLPSLVGGNSTAWECMCGDPEVDVGRQMKDSPGAQTVLRLSEKKRARLLRDHAYPLEGRTHR
jgi:hypothetical protein